ncbi:TRAP transporter large permease subunit [Azospirillum sp. RWY-5-1]|uniref:TRAP transporter large permease protein n=1 Tax=Azospirillum oleiclasticum TaxID=2735135 RepID=A0ABX2T4K2_9PROT|nr:TRAP transporter large permease subunit [Azospirillum oleiclasticum]NYZ10921.1 TRAP transporter large permease subunit [Azospirillum oleiclasticum]NYZ18083.1 TRAP transporter large permease subunit [Azospirillum oleiclasticum]
MPLNEILAIGCILSFFAMLAIGIPVALTLAVSGFVFGWLGFGSLLFNLLPARIYGVTANYTLIAIPLFVFMGVMLEKSRIADELMEVIGHVSGSLRGGMGLGIILVGVLMGATTGIVGATIVTLGLLTLPTLLRRGYDKRLACGTICAAGTLGQLIPPSTILILLADIMGQSVGTLFAAAVVPGLLLAGIFCAAMLLLGVLRPDMVPPIPIEERRALPRRVLLEKVLKVGLPPVALVLAVLGSIIGGVAAPTEAASMGAIGSILVAAIAGRLSWGTLVQTVHSTARITAAMMFVLICSQVFALAFRGLHGEKLVQDAFALVPGGVDGVILFMIALIFVLGFFIEWIEISYIVVPMFLPVLQAGNVDPVWTATLIAVILQTSFLTPPFGWALFYLRGVAPPEVATLDIYKGVVPFILLQLAAVAVIFLYPDLATWLPRAIGW